MAYGFLYTILGFKFVIPGFKFVSLRCVLLRAVTLRRAFVRPLLPSLGPPPMLHPLFVHSFVALLQNYWELLELDEFDSVAECVMSELDSASPEYEMILERMIR